MLRSLVSLWIVAALWIGPASAAAIEGQSTALTPLLPARGTYYDASKSGTGITVDVSQDGFVFLTYYGYDATGVPTWYSVQGQWSASTEAKRVATGVIGTLNQPLLRSSGGQCLTCDFTSKPSVTPQPYTVNASWTTPRHVDITIGNQSWHMDAGRFVADEDLPTGTWQASVSWGYDSRLVFVAAQPVATQVGVVVIGEKRLLSGAPIGFGAVLDPNADPSIQLPPKGSYFYGLSGHNICPPLPGQPPPPSGAFVDLVSATAQSTYFPSGNAYITPVLWYEPSSHRGGLEMITQFMGVDVITMAFGPNNVHFDVYVEPDRIVGHGVVQGANVNGIPGVYWAPNSVTLNLVMQRLPAGVNEGRVRELICPL